MSQRNSSMEVWIKKGIAIAKLVDKKIETNSTIMDETAVLEELENDHESN